MKNYFYFYGLIGLLSTSGCAWYNMTPITNEDVSHWGEGNKQGYVFYQPELYFAATITQVTASTNDQVSTKQNVTVAPIYLPNPQKGYRVKTHNFLAKAGYNFAFTDGWKLTQIGDTSDNTSVASSLIGQLSSMATAAANIARMANTNETKLSPQTNTVVFLYRPTYGSDGTITGFEPRGKMEITPPSP